MNIFVKWLLEIAALILIVILIMLFPSGDSMLIFILKCIAMVIVIIAAMFVFIHEEHKVIECLECDAEIGVDEDKVINTHDIFVLVGTPESELMSKKKWFDKEAVSYCTLDVSKGEEGDYLIPLKRFLHFKG